MRSQNQNRASRGFRSSSHRRCEAPLDGGRASQRHSEYRGPLWALLQYKLFENGKCQLPSEALFAGWLLPYRTRDSLASAFDSCLPCDVTFSSHPLEHFHFVNLSSSDLRPERWGEKGMEENSNDLVALVAQALVAQALIRVLARNTTRNGECVIAMLKHVSQITIRRISCLPLRDTNEGVFLFCFFPLLLPICAAKDSIEGVLLEPSERSCSVLPNTGGKMGLRVLE